MSFEDILQQAKDRDRKNQLVKKSLTPPKPLPPAPKKATPNLLADTSKIYQQSALLGGNLGKMYAKTLPEAERIRIAQDTEKSFAKAPFHSGAIEGYGLVSQKALLENTLGQTIKTPDNFAYKAGEFAGTMGQFATGYGLAGGAVTGSKVGMKVLPKLTSVATKGVSKVAPKLATETTQKIGRGIADSLVKDIAIGVPLNVNMALNKEGLRGTDALKSIGINTAIDLLAGGVFETIGGIVLKSGKKVTSKADFDKLPEAEKAEVMTELERLAYESNVRKGKVTPQGDTLYGNAFSPIAGELPAPISRVQQGRVGAKIKPEPTTAKAEGVFKDYYPERRATDVLKGGDFHPATIEAGLDPEEFITVYRGAPKNQKSINNGDWVTTSEQLAKDYAGSGKIIKSEVQAKYLYAPKGEGLDELIYSTNQKVQPKPIPRLQTKLTTIYDTAKGQREVPRTITPNELSRTSRPTPQPIPQAPNRPVEPQTLKSGINVSKEQAFAENLKMGEKVIGLERGNSGTIAKVNQDGSYLVHFLNKETGKEALIKMQRSEFEPVNKTINDMRIKQADLPKRDRNSFDAEFMEKTDQNYKQFMDDTSDYGEPTTMGAGEFAQAITGKGVSRGKDIQRNADAALRNTPSGRKWFKDNIEDPLYQSKGRYATEVRSQLDNLYNNVVKGMGINKGSDESAAMQWLGEGKRQIRNPKGKIISNVTENYGLDNLKADFNYTMKNGKKAWENIVEAEKIARKTYDDYVDKINDALRKIYPNVEENVAKLQAKLAKATDEPTRKKILQEIEDATIGKRLMPRKDYYRHFKEMESKFIGLDNIINGATNIDPRLLGVSEFSQPKSKWTGFMQRRKDGDIYAEDAIGGLLEYIPQAEYKVNIEPMIPVMRNVIKDLKESTIQSRNANAFIDELMQITNDLAGKTNEWDRTVTKFLGDERGRKVLNTLSALSNRMRANAVVGNANTILVQPFNLPNVVGYAKNPQDLTVGFRQSIQASMGNKEAQELLAKSDFLRERYLDRSFRRFDMGMTSNINRFFSFALEVGDKAVADGAWLTFYRQAGKQGMSEADSIRFADEFTRKSIGGRGIAEMPLSQKAKVTKMLAPFQVEVRNAVNVMTDMGREKDIAGLMGVFITSFIMNEVLEKATGRRVTFDPIDVLRNGATQLYQGEDLETAAKGTALGLAGETISNLPGGSYIAAGAQNALGIDEYTMQKLFGENDPSRFGTGNIAIQTLGAPLGQMARGQNIDLLKPAMAVLPKFGGKQLERGIRGLQDMAVLPKETINSEGVTLKRQDAPGSYSPSGRLRFALEDSAKNYAIAPTLGTWATKEGKEYIQNKQTPLGESDMVMFDSLRSLGVEPSKAEDITRGFDGLTKKDEKMKYIDSLDISPNAKKVLLKDVLGYSTENITPQQRKDFGIDRAGLTTDQRTEYRTKVAPLKISDKVYAKIINGIDANDSGRVSHEEAIAMLDSTGLTKYQKYMMWNVIDSRWSEKNNPYK